MLLAVVAAPMPDFVRLLTLAAQGDWADLSHRTVIWPVYYEAASLRSPLFGWGTEAAKVLVPVGSCSGICTAPTQPGIAVDDGVVGVGTLPRLLCLWLRRGTRATPGPERAVTLLVYLAFALHSTTDNTLIATTASLMFAWVSAVFAQPEHEGSCIGQRGA